MQSQQGSDLEGNRPSMGRAVVPPGLNDPDWRVEMGLPHDEELEGDYVVELNLLYKGGLQEAIEKFQAMWDQVIGAETRSRRAPILIAKTYYSCQMTVREWRRLVAFDEQSDQRERLIYRIWPDFPVNPLIDRSVATVKADAASRSYAATGEGIIWAVIDSGIDKNHVHFWGEDNEDHEDYTLLSPDVVALHRDFTQDPPVQGEAALTDELGHGTHVAGIIAGGLRDYHKFGRDFQIYERVLEADPSGANNKPSVKVEERKVSDASRLRGVAPKCKLISLKVLGPGASKTTNVMKALEYVQGLNAHPKQLRVHGVNLSVGYEFDAEMFACGQSPLCVEVDRLVKSGVVVVVAAGNTGYSKLSALYAARTTKVGLSNTINDPGNAALAITVGSTHRDSPYIYGVSYFSSKGPTGDGRLKPDLVAPGERITSCAVGQRLAMNGIKEGPPAYIDDTGTSMAAPHVSGAIAAFLSIRREFIQRPEEVKRIFPESATPLGRERYFEGHGLLDLMRAIQSV